MRVIKASLIFIYVLALLLSMAFNIVQHRNVMVYKEQSELLVIDKRAESVPSLLGDCEKIIAAANIGGGACWSLVDMDKDGASDLLMVGRYGEDTDVYTLVNHKIEFIGSRTGDVFYTFEEDDGSIGLSARAGYGTGVGGIRVYHMPDMSYFGNEECYEYCYLPTVMDKTHYSCGDKDITEEVYNKALGYYCADENAIKQHEYTPEEISKYLYNSRCKSGF